ncbi:IMV membrane protein A21, partial [Monkeypox virus]
MITLFLILC